MGATDEPPGRALRTPRAAGAAGMLSALLLGTVVVLVHAAIPDHPTDAGAWLADGSSRDSLNVALQLVPFAGIFFLWFMGAVRDYVGAAEDKFFATLFFGSGVLYLAVIFVLAAAVGGLLALAGSASSAQLRMWEYGRHLTLVLLSSYSTRIAAVFVLSATTLCHRLGMFPRWLTWSGYAVAVVLLFVVSTDAWFALVFPLWVLVVSTRVLRVALRPTTQPE
ncbi:hypothetical protein ABVG11_03815 [Streptomyces sp. HD1123-B1]|uniref:hypothetical protein n=1 Tax=Streptomyces huangiella TaxID=3228804 RepID=UPI003D7F0C37